MVAPIEDVEWITQKIRYNRPNINSPRPQDSDGVSAFRGRVGPEDAYRLVVKSGRPTENDGVRYTQAGTLREAGFEVNPSPNIRNPLHVSISRQDTWGEREARRFVSCFTETDWYEEEEDQS